jgi:hypothetical protein
MNSACVSAGVSPSLLFLWRINHQLHLIDYGHLTNKYILFHSEETINFYKLLNNLPTKAKLGNAVHSAALTWRLPTRFLPFTSLLRGATRYTIERCAARFSNRRCPAICASPTTSPFPPSLLPLPLRTPSGRAGGLDTGLLVLGSGADRTFGLGKAFLSFQCCISLLMR